MNFVDFEADNIIKYDFDLSKVCTMRTGGKAKYAFFPSNIAQMQRVLSFLKMNNIKYTILGNGSNVVFPDSGYNGAVICTSGLKEYYIYEDEASCDEFVRIKVSAGVLLTSVALKMSKLGYTGLEFAYGIPASVGGAVFMNAGAYGGEMGSIIESVEYLNEDHKLCILNNDVNKQYFSYRHSFFMENPEFVIVSAVLKLCKAVDFHPLAVAENNMKARKEKQPLEYPSCGSAFKRPQGYYAGALIEQAGLKGKSIGGACVSEKHAGFIINKGGATTSDVTELISYVKKTVLEHSGVELEPEIKIIED